jgi:hypothetical protein
MLTSGRSTPSPISQGPLAQYVFALIHYGFSARYQRPIADVLRRIQVISSCNIPLLPRVMKFIITSLTGSHLSLDKCSTIIISLCDIFALGTRRKGPFFHDDVFAQIVRLGFVKKPNEPWKFIDLLHSLRMKGVLISTSGVMSETLHCIRIFTSPSVPQESGQFRRAWTQRDSKISTDEMIRSFNDAWSAYVWD